MPISPTPRHRVTLQSVWIVENAESVPLTDGTFARLGPYLTRYAETMNVRVHAVGGAAGHLHLLYDLPPDQNASGVTLELQRASARFVGVTLNVAGFAWNADAYTVSVSPERIALVADYIARQEELQTSGGALDAVLEGTGVSGDEPSNDETPAWLRDALQNSGSR